MICLYLLIIMLYPYCDYCLFLFLFFDFDFDFDFRLF